MAWKIHPFPVNYLLSGGGLIKILMNFYSESKLVSFLLKNKTIMSRKFKLKGWFGIPPWFILGSVIILVPILIFWTYENLARERRFTNDLLLEKGVALIQSLEAATRTGMMGMHGDSFQFLRLLYETAQQPDINYLIITDTKGNILAHNDPSKIGKVHAKTIDLGEMPDANVVQWQKVTNSEGIDTYEVFRRFLSTDLENRDHHGRMTANLMNQLLRDKNIEAMNTGYVIFVGLDMKSIEAARREDARHSVIMALILLLVGFSGLFTLFLTQAFRSARTTLTRVQAFSDNVVENMPIGLLAVDAEGIIVSYNHTAEVVLGFSPRQVLGKKSEDILPFQLTDLITEVKTSNEVIEKEIDCPVRDGKLIPMEVSVSLLEGADNTFLGYIILFRDLTEIQDLKKEIELSQRLASVGKLAAGVAHEIRNPLSSIKGFATFFSEKLGDIPEYKSTADIMIHEVERVDRVITDLLEFARPLEVKKKSVPIKTVLQHSLKLIESKAQAKNIRINTKFSTEIKQAQIDQDRIQQVLLNLYLNSIEAMEEGGTLQVDLSVAENQQALVISISDDGLGIKKEDLVHIFDPYFTTKQTGTGLGLAIVHKIIESHNGELKVVSEVGKGTRITITLPL